MELTPAQRINIDIENRFGLLPNFFRLAQDPEIMANLWGFARFAYLDNPLPSLFKERLFVYVSRFCEVRYCIARHVGFLVGLGRPSGDAACAVQSVDEVLDLIRRPLLRGEGLQPALAQCEACESTLLQLPATDSAMERALFACATHVFLQSPDAARCLRALECSLGKQRVQHLTVFLAFVRTAHFWTKTHEDLNIEEDVSLLLKTHEALARCVLSDPEATSSVFSAYEALHEADRRKGEFLAMLAHELRNPLAAIHNAVQVLLRSGGDARIIQSAAEILNRQVAHMGRQVDDLLDVNRINQGKIELRKVRTDMVPVVNDAVEATRPHLESSGHELTVKLPRKAVYVHGDAIRLSQVVGNVLSNACKFTDNGGCISLTLEPEGEHAVVRVQDTGLGIAREQLGRIFELFAQVKTPLDSSHGGLGIGLTLVKNLVEMHGGTVEARSAGIGQGSEFVIRLPLNSEVPTIAQEPAVGPSSPRPRRILVVDDNRDCADSLATLLKLTGHDVYTANDGLEAVEAAAILQPDVILLDIGMPRLNGYEAARRIREQPRHRVLTLVALTGWDQPEDRGRSEDAGFDAHLVKPVDLVALTKLLAESDSGRRDRHSPDDPARARQDLKSKPRAKAGTNVTSNPHRKILIVDDNLDSGSTISLLLEAAGWPTIAKSSVRDALEALDTDTDIGVVVADVRMPDYDGFDLLRVVKHRYPQLPVILITGLPIVPEDVVPLHAVILQKPVSTNELLSAIEGKLGRNMPTIES